MLECSNCGKYLEILRPKFFMILEKEWPLPANVKEFTCPECNSINYSLDTVFCLNKCEFSKNVITNDIGQIVNMGCHGECLRKGFFDSL